MDSYRCVIRTMIVAIGLATISGLCVGADAEATGDMSPILPAGKTTEYRILNPTGSSAPAYSHGYLIQVKHHTTSAGDANVYLFNTTGVLDRKVSLGPKGTTNLSLSSVDVGSTSRLIFAGEATKADNSQIDFIGFSNLDGSAATYINTGHYRTEQIVEGNDGSIWTLGCARYEDTEGASEMSGRKWTNYNALHHYSASGQLIQEFLPRWSSNTAYVVEEIKQDSSDPGKTRAVLTGYDQQDKPVSEYKAPVWGIQRAYRSASPLKGQVWLQPSANGVVVLDGHASAIYEFTQGSGSTRRQKITPVTIGSVSTRITGFAVLPNNTYYASVQSVDGKTRGLFTLRVPTAGTATASWVALPSTLSRGSAAGSFKNLVGVDSGALVYRVRSSGTGEATLAWSSPAQAADSANK